ncbi:hypothetical protein BH11PLA2_BH11PLA2_04820 [soil metagenome]
MKHPHVIILGFDEWLARQIRPLCDEHRWLLHDVRQPGAAKTLLHERRPAVLAVQIDPHAETSPGIALLAETHSMLPDVMIVVVSDGKLPDEDRSRWTASLLDLGAGFVLFPPLTGPVLEDLVGGLMSALLSRLRPSMVSDVIDLAEEGTVPL